MNDCYASGCEKGSHKCGRHTKPDEPKSWPGNEYKAFLLKRLNDAGIEGIDLTNVSDALDEYAQRARAEAVRECRDTLPEPTSHEEAEYYDEVFKALTDKLKEL